MLQFYASGRLLFGCKMLTDCLDVTADADPSQECTSLIMPVWVQEMYIGPIHLSLSVFLSVKEGLCTYRPF